MCYIRTGLFSTQAAKRNLVYPNYVWIIYAAYPDKWWTAARSGGKNLTDCPDEVLEQFLIDSRAFTIHALPEPDLVDEETDAGIVKLFPAHSLVY